ncbi:MAG: hypothetical protein Q8R12_00390 [bacterium]|nr:hypothetical protein [bacterium]
MLDNRRNLILIIGFIVILAISFLIYVWRQASGPPQAPLEQPGLSLPPFGAPRAEPKKEAPSLFGNIVDTFREAFTQPREDISAPRPQTEEKFLSFLSPQERAIEELRRKIVSGEIKIQAPLPHKYTPEEIFHLQYPDYFLDYLSTLQGSMLEENYIKTGDAIAFKSHGDILKFIRTYINFLADSGALIFRNKEDREKYIDNVLANILLLNVLEADLLEKGALTPSP